MSSTGAVIAWNDNGPKYLEVKSSAIATAPDGSLNPGPIVTVTSPTESAFAPNVVIDGDAIIIVFTLSSSLIPNNPLDVGLATSPSPGQPFTEHAVTTDHKSGFPIIYFGKGDKDGSPLQTVGSQLATLAVSWLHYDAHISGYEAVVAPGGITGDANCDGGVHADDLLATLAAAAGIGNAVCLAGADTNCDGSVTVGDALRILLALANIQQVTPQGCSPIGG